MDRVRAQVGNAALVLPLPFTDIWLAQEKEFYDVKFYPYSPPGSLPVFAIVGRKRVSLASI